MNKLQLSDDENIIKKYDYVWWYPEGDGHGGELYITNKNLIFWYETGIFNTAQHLEKIPLNRIKNSKGSYSLNYNDDEELVEIYYPGGQEEFNFDDEKNAKRFMQDLEECLKKISIDDEEEKKETKNGQKICSKCGHNNDINAKFCNNCGANMSESSISSKSELIKETPKSNKNKCKSCGAILTGSSGQTVKCEYCDFVQVIE